MIAGLIAKTLIEYYKHIACNVLFAGNKKEEGILPNTSLNHLMLFNRPVKGSITFFSMYWVFSFFSTPPAFLLSPKVGDVKRIFEYLKNFYVVYFHCPWQEHFRNIWTLYSYVCVCVFFSVFCSSFYKLFLFIIFFFCHVLFLLQFYKFA